MLALFHYKIVIATDNNHRIQVSELTAEIGHILCDLFQLLTTESTIICGQINMANTYARAPDNELE